MTEETDQPNNLIRAYDRFAEWFQILKPVYYDPETTQKLAAFIRRLNPEARSILDCACGVGSTAIDLSRMGFEVICSDFSRGMLKYARNNAQEAGTSRMTFCESDWRDLQNDVQGTFDCIINLGVNIYHLRGQDILNALWGMKKKLKPGGLLLIDNKKWQELLSINNGNQELRLIEKRPIIRVYSSNPLSSHEGQSYYFFDIAWSEGGQWIIEVFRLAREDVHDLLKTQNKAFVSLANHLISIKIRNGNFIARYCHERQIDSQCEQLPYESILIPGYPVTSANLAASMEEIGLKRISIRDKHEALYGELGTAKNKLYDLIIADNPR